MLNNKKINKDTTPCTTTTYVSSTTLTCIAPEGAGRNLLVTVCFFCCFIIIYLFIIYYLLFVICYLFMCYYYCNLHFWFIDINIITTNTFHKKL